MRIEPLRNHAEVLSTLVRWFETEWAPYYGPAGPGSARDDLSAAIDSNAGALPETFVALDDAGAVRGPRHCAHLRFRPTRA